MLLNSSTVTPCCDRGCVVYLFLQTSEESLARVVVRLTAFPAHGAGPLFRVYHRVKLCRKIIGIEQRLCLLYAGLAAAVVAEHVALPAEFEVAGVDDAPPFVAVGDDLEQETCSVDVDGQVAQFIDDQEPIPADGREFPVEPVGLFGLAQPHDQAGGSEEPDQDGLAAGLPAYRDGQVCLAAADVAVEREVLGVFDEVERGRVAPAPVAGEYGCAPVIAARVPWTGGSPHSSADAGVWIVRGWCSRHGTDRA